MTLIPLQFPSLPIRKDLYKRFWPQHIRIHKKVPVLYHIYLIVILSYLHFPWIQPTTDGMQLYFLLEIICFSVDKSNSKACCLRVNCILNWNESYSGFSLTIKTFYQRGMSKRTVKWMTLPKYSDTSKVVSNVEGIRLKYNKSYSCREGILLWNCCKCSKGLQKSSTLSW